MFGYIVPLTEECAAEAKSLRGSFGLPSLLKATLPCGQIDLGCYQFGSKSLLACRFRKPDLLHVFWVFIGRMCWQK